MFTNILIPLDGSFVGETALPFARAIARRSGARLTLVRAARTPLFTGDHGVDQLRALTEAEQYLTGRAQQLAADGFTVETGVPLAGSAANWIVEEASMRKANLIVMGTHDRSGPNRWLHGSVAEAVVSRATVPVLLVRAADGMRPIEPFGGQPPELVVPLDGSSLAEAALPLARTMTKTFGGHVVLVGVIPSPAQLVAQQVGTIGAYVGSDYAQLEQDTRSYLELIAGGLTASGLSVDTTVRQGKPATEIDEVARERGAAVVIMATHGRTGLVRALLGSVAGEVLHQGTSPVMLIRPVELRPAEVPATSQLVSRTMPA
jgi:nucleotide-binding universal stress UspA family protein